MFSRPLQWMAEIKISESSQIPKHSLLCLWKVDSWIIMWQIKFSHYKNRLSTFSEVWLDMVNKMQEKKLILCTKRHIELPASCIASFYGKLPPSYHRPCQGSNPKGFLTHRWLCYITSTHRFCDLTHLLEWTKVTKINKHSAQPGMMIINLSDRFFFSFVENSN